MQSTIRTSEPTAQPDTSPINTPASRAASRLLDRLQIAAEHQGGQLSTWQRLQKRAAETLVPAFGREVRHG